MPEVVTYSNTSRTCYSTIRLDNGQKIFISIVGSPSPSVTVYESRLLGLRNRTIWEFTPQMAGGYDAYVRKMARAFAGMGERAGNAERAIDDLLGQRGPNKEVLDRFFSALDQASEPGNPLDAIVGLVMTCGSANDVRDRLFEAERRMATPLPGEE